jgi:hypothetical protein
MYRQDETTAVRVTDASGDAIDLAKLLRPPGLEDEAAEAGVTETPQVTR